MKESYWERKMREKFPFLYPSERIAADIGKGVIIGLLTVVAGLLLIDIGISFIGSDKESVAHDTESAWENRLSDYSTTTYKYENIVFQVVGNGFDNSILKIFQDEELVFSKEDGGFYALGLSCPGDASTTNCNPDSSQTFGIDINGNGNKDFVFADVQGGNAGYVSYKIFEISKEGRVKELVSLEYIPGEDTFTDLNDDGKLDVELLDSTFAFWHTDHASSPYPTVYLSWDNAMQIYTLDLSLTRKPPPSESEINEQVNFYKNTDWCVEIDGSYGKGIYCSMPWGYALDLIYSGNATSAKKYLEAVWPFVSDRLINDDYHEFPTYATAKYLENEILLELKQSPYYRDIFTLNGGKIF